MGTVGEGPPFVNAFDFKFGWAPAAPVNDLRPTALFWSAPSRSRSACTGFSKSRRRQRTL